jgi:hypothetical protein
MMMYRQTKFSEILYKIREQISQEAEFDAVKLAKMLIEEHQSSFVHKTNTTKHPTENAKTKNENEDLDVIYDERV